MKRFTVLALLCGILFLHSADAQDKKEPRPDAKSAKSELAIYFVKNGDAIQLAEVVARHFNSEAEVIVAPAGSGNAVLISGSATSVPEVVKLLDQLDKKPRTVEVEITLADVPAKDWKGGDVKPEELTKLGTVQRIKLTSIEGQPVTSTNGGNKPFVTSEAGIIGPKGGVQRSISYSQVGTTVKLTARTRNDAIVVDLDLKDSRVKPAIPGDPVTAPTMETASLTTKLNVPTGKSVVVQALRTDDKNSSTIAVVIVTARVVEP